MEDTHVHALDYLSVARRRRWWLIVPVLASIVIGVGLLAWLPKEYTSSTTLGVTEPIVSPALVNQSAALDNQERLRALSQQLLSPMILERVIAEEHLAGGGGDDQSARLRKAITVSVPEPMARAPEPRRLDTFVVSYADSDPQRARRIANRLATVFVDQNSQLRTEHAEDTSAFIATQLRASESRLAELESRLRKAKEAHMGRLPEQTPANLQTLTGLRQQYEANATALRGEQDRLVMIERQIEALRQGRTDYAPAGRGSDPIPLPPESRVLAAERDLAAARATYTDKHPEVLRLREELAAARRDAVSEKQRPDADRVAQLQLDPAYRQAATDREMTRLRLREIERSASDLLRQISAYQARVESAPMVEQQLLAMERDYNLEKQQYGELSGKLHAASLAENVERNRRGEQFMVLYAASLPTTPTKPVPWRVMTMAILAGICAGAVLMIGREYLDRSVHDVRELRESFDVPVLAEIARIESA